jgi:hypothetical protein
MSDLLAICEVARDLVELQRIDEAKALLDEQAPTRHDEWCAACGAYGAWVDIPGVVSARKGSPCQEMGIVTCRFCAGSGRRQSFDIQTTPALRSIVHCTECFGTGKREQLVDMIVPHESRLCGKKRPW